MTLDATRACELLVGLEDVAVLAVDEGADGLRVIGGLRVLDGM
jgi:hypothetical protein